MKILIVEDEFLIGEELKYILQDLGYEVRGPAGTCEEAVARLAERPDLVFVDTRLGTECTGRS